MRYRPLVLAAFLLVFLDPSAKASISTVQSNSSEAGTSGTTVSATFSANTTAGNLIAVACMSAAVSGTVSVTDTSSSANAYSLVGSYNVNAALGGVQWSYAMNISGGADTVTCTFGVSSTSRSIFIYEISGLSTAIPLDAQTGLVGSGTTPNSGPENSTSANEIVLGAARCGSTCSAGSGFTGISDGHGNETEFKVVSVTGVQQTPFSQTSATWADSMVTFSDTGALAQMSLANAFTNTNAFKNSVILKGPLYDLQNYGVRSLASTTTIPAVSGITASTTSSSPTVTVSTSSCSSQTGSICFVNGDGVVIVGAGAANTITVPGSVGVTPYNARICTGCGDGVAAPSGSNTYNYKVFACDVGGGCSAPSATVSTTTGATLGANSVAITSASRSNNTITFNTSSQPPFSPGTVVHVDACNSADTVNGFNGWFEVSTVTSGGFTTANTTLDTRNGAATATTGACTANWWNYNRIIFTTSGTAAYRYFACSDRQTPGTFQLLLQSLVAVDPNNLGTGEGNLEIDDFGQTMEASTVSSMPWYLSNSYCTGSATNDNWTTTISSGAGTTSLVMSGNAPNAVSGATIRFDNGPTMKAAMNTGFVNFFLSGGSYVVNSFLSFSQAPILWIYSNLVLNDTMYLTSGARIYGDRISLNASADSFQVQSNPVIQATVNPGILISTSGSNVFNGITLHGPVNGIAIECNGGGGNLGSTFDNDNIETSGGASDYLGIAFLKQGCPMMGGALYIASGTQGTTNQSFTPSFYSDQDSETVIDDLMGNARTVLVRPTASGSSFRVGHFHVQGATMPQFVISASGAGSAGLTLMLGDKGPLIEDTAPQALLACLPNAGSPILGVAVYNFINGPASGVNALTGTNCLAGTNLILSGQNVSASAVSTKGASISDSGTVGPSQLGFTNTVPAIGFLMTSPGAPTLSQVGGTGCSVPTGLHTYQLAWFDANNNFTQLGASAQITVNSGTQCVTVTPPTGAPGAVGYFLARDGLFLANSGGNCANYLSSVGLGAYVDKYASACNNDPPSFNNAMATALSAQAIDTPKLGIVGNGFVNSQSGSFTAARSSTWPDLSGTVELVLASGTTSVTPGNSVGCTDTTATATGAATTNRVVVSPQSPQSNTSWSGFISASNTVDIRVCTIVVLTGSATNVSWAVLP